MNVLELFAGSRSFGRLLEDRGHTVFSVDWKGFPGVDLVKDIGYLVPADIPFIPDFIHLSPDCATYSVAAFHHHRNGVLPKTDYAIKCDRVNINALHVVRYFRAVNPGCIFTIENPRGMLRKMPFMIGIPRATVWYCKYGDFRAKPTDIWTNNLYSMFNPVGWVPRPGCWNNNPFCHHEKSPREEDNKGTCRLPDSYERSIIPESLCTELINSVIRFNQVGSPGFLTTQFDQLPLKWPL